MQLSLAPNSYVEEDDLEPEPPASTGITGTSYQSFGAG